MTIQYRLSLDYQLNAGWLEPFVHALQQGLALARCCRDCKKTTFPPVRTCECKHTNAEWVNLSGKAHILYRCDGSDGSFALVQFEGADTQSVVLLDAMTDADTVGWLNSSRLVHPDGEPALVITPDQRGTDP